MHVHIDTQDLLLLGNLKLCDHTESWEIIGVLSIAAVINYQTKAKFLEGKASFGSHVWKLQSTVSWPCCFEAVMKQLVVVEMNKTLHPHTPEEIPRGKEKRGRWRVEAHPFQRCASVTQGPPTMLHLPKAS